ncbi:MAG: thiamine-monophosphate kinase [Phycisphaerales bacterium]|nr:thiamine-monophosphate kinase [Phycisphaerales bacterium]
MTHARVGAPGPVAYPIPTMPGEFDFIAWLRSQQTASALVPVPAGDDLAVLNWPKDDLLLVGVDQVLDGVHFDSAVYTPRQIGAKVMNRNLSDCAAMACLPAAAVVSAAMHRGSSLEYAKELYLGMKEAGDAFGCAIVGGDTGSWTGKLALSVTILGRSAGVTPITRKAAGAAQRIYVTGPLGGSVLGRHMSFTPRVLEARQIAATGAVRAMIDLSDGISRDLGHICRESGVGAILYADRIPVHADAGRMARAGWSPLEHALHDGEDYELLYVADREMPAGIPGIFVGITTAEPGVRLRTAAGGDVALEVKGWEHVL